MATREEIILEVTLASEEARKNAARLEDQLKRLSTQRSRLNKELKELQAGEDRLVSVRADQTTQLAELIQQGRQETAEFTALQGAIQDTDTAFSSIRAEIDKVTLELTDNKATTSEAKRELRLLQREITGGSDSLEAQRTELIRLNREYDTFQIGVNGTAKDLKDLENQIAKLTTNILEQEKATGRAQRNVGNYGSAIKDAFAGSIPGVQQFTQVLAGPVGIITALTAGVGKLGVEFVKLSTDIAKTRKEVELLLGGNEGLGNIDEINSKVRATARTFNLEFNEVLAAANTTAREFGITIPEALQEINTGLALGANRNGDFLDQLREYPAQFREIGVSASQFIALSTRATQEGIFSDKAVDAVKEFSLRIRELTPAAEEALDRTGLSGRKLQEEIESGQKTVFEALQEVSDQINIVGLNSDEAATLVTDLFGGPGEDAGIRFLSTLGSTNLELDEMVAEVGRAAERQLELNDANESIERSFAALTGSSGDFFEEIRVGATVLVADFLQRAIVGIEDLVNGFVETYNQSLVLRSGLQAIVAVITTIIRFSALLRENFLDTFANVGEIIGALLRGEFSAIPDLVGEAFSDLGENFVEFGTDVGETWSGAFQEATEGQLEKIDLTSSLSGSGDSAESAGGRAGARYTQAFINSLNAEQLREEIESLNGVLAETANEETRTQIETNIRRLQNRLQKVSEGATDTDPRTQEERQKLVKLREELEREKQLRISALEGQREAILESTELTESQRLLIKQGFAREIVNVENEIAEREGVDEEELQREEARIQAKLSVIRQGSREEVELRRQLLRVQRDQSLQNDELLAEERIRIQAEYLAEVQTLENNSLQSRLEQELQALDLQEAAIMRSFLRREITEQEHSERLFALREERLETELEQLEQGTIERIKKEIELEELRIERKKTLEDEEKERKTLAEQEDEEREMRTREAINETVTATREATQLIIDSKEAEIRADVERMGISGEAAERIVQDRLEESRAVQAAKAINKAAAVVEVGISLQTQIQAIAETSAKIAKLFPPASVPLGIAYGIAKTALAIASARSSLQRITALEEGGPTGEVSQTASPGSLQIEGNRIQEAREPRTFLQRIRRATFEGRPVEKRRTFAKGGTINRPSLGLIGEKGTEYVIPQKVLQIPGVANIVQNQLEPLRRRAISGFAIGGPTIPSYTFANMPVLGLQDGGLSSFNSLRQVEQNLSVEALVNFEDTIRKLPNPVVFVEDVNTGQERHAEVRDSGDI